MPQLADRISSFFPARLFGAQIVFFLQQVAPHLSRGKKPWIVLIQLEPGFQRIHRLLGIVSRQPLDLLKRLHQLVLRQQTTNSRHHMIFGEPRKLLLLHLIELEIADVEPALPLDKI